MGFGLREVQLVGHRKVIFCLAIEGKQHFIKSCGVGSPDRHFFRQELIKKG